MPRMSLLKTELATGVFVGALSLFGCNPASGGKKSSSPSPTTDGATTNATPSANPCLLIADDATTAAGGTTGTDTGTTGATAGTTDATTAATTTSSASDGCSANASTQTPSTDTGTPAVDTTPSPTGGNWTPGPGLESCVAQGKAWVAVSADNGPGACGDALATWCCNDPEVRKLFPGYSDLPSRLDAYKTQGLKLYNCSQANGTTRLHFASGGASGVQYAWIDIPSLGQDDGSGASCQTLSSTDLGLPAAAATTTTLPDTIGPLTNLQGSGLQDFLANADNYASWTHDSSVHPSAGPHGMVQTYFNPTLAASMAAGNTQHPVGSVAIMRVYLADKTTPVGHAVLAKASAGTDAGTWFFYSADDDGHTASILGLGNTATDCAACHQTGKDYIRSTLP